MSDETRTFKAIQALTYAAGMAPSEVRSALLLASALLYATGVLAEHGQDHMQAILALAKHAVAHANFAERAQNRQ